MTQKYMLLLLCLSAVQSIGDPLADAKPESSAEPTTKAEPISKTDPVTDSDAEPEAAVISHRGTPFAGITPISERPFGFIHSTPAPVFPHFISNFAKHKLKAHFVPTRGPIAYGHPNNPIHPPYPPHPAHALKYCEYAKAPLCSYNTTKPWCLYDLEYPEYEIVAAIQHHKEHIIGLYADVADLSTKNSVVRPNTLYEETYLCASDTEYARPLRGVNTDGKWRVIVNDVKVDYDIFSQTIRLEECLTYGKPCHMIPGCYDSKCVQKSIYHRFLVYDPCDQYLPFAIETFKLPASCACIVGKFYLNH